VEQIRCKKSHPLSRSDYGRLSHTCFISLIKSWTFNITNLKNTVFKEVVCTEKYAGDLVLLAKEGTILQSKTGKLIEIGCNYGIQRNVESLK